MLKFWQVSKKVSLHIPEIKWLNNKVIKGIQLRVKNIWNDKKSIHQNHFFFAHTIQKSTKHVVGGAVHLQENSNLGDKKESQLFFQPRLL